MSWTRFIINRDSSEFRTARHRAVDFIRQSEACAISEDDLESFILSFGEGVQNAILYGGGENQDIEITIDATPNVLYCTITDHGAGFDPDATLQQEYALRDSDVDNPVILEHMRGMLLIREFSDYSVWNSTATGTCLRFAHFFPRPAV